MTMPEDMGHDLPPGELLPALVPPESGLFCQAVYGTPAPFTTCGQGFLISRSAVGLSTLRASILLHQTAIAKYVEHIL